MKFPYEPMEVKEQCSVEGIVYFMVQTKSSRDGWEVADIRPDIPNQRKVAELFAAAPDLLEALEALADSAPSACCVDFHHKPGDYHDADESCPALDRYEAACLSARAAIARARGEA